MKRKTLTHGLRLLCVLALAMSLTTAAFAADPPEPTQPSPCYRASHELCDTTARTSEY